MVPSANSSIDAHGYLANWERANKFFSYYAFFCTKEFKPLLQKYSILSDIKQSFYFRSIGCLANFFQPKSDLSLERLKACKNADSIELVLKPLKVDPNKDKLLALRNKRIAHYDSDWYLNDLGFPDESFPIYLEKIRVALRLAFSVDLEYKSYSMSDAFSQFGKLIENP